MKNILIGLFCLCGFTALAQEDFSAEEREGHLVLSRDSLEEEVGLIPEAIDADVDSLLHSWHVRYFSKTEEYCHDDEENVYFPDSIYIERLERLPRVITLPYNNIVRDCIDLYAERSASATWCVICWEWPTSISPSSSRYSTSMGCLSS